MGGRMRMMDREGYLPIVAYFRQYLSTYLDNTGKSRKTSVWAACL